VVSGDPSAHAGGAYIQKPFTARALLAQVRAVLEQGSGQLRRPAWLVGGEAGARPAAGPQAGWAPGPRCPGVRWLAARWAAR
jgi:hypothetical protein